MKKSVKSIDFFVMLNYLYFKVPTHVIAKRLIIVDNIMNENVNIKETISFWKDVVKQLFSKYVNCSESFEHLVSKKKKKDSETRFWKVVNF